MEGFCAVEVISEAVIGSEGASSSVVDMIANVFGLA